MERVLSLINKLSGQAQANATAAELLATTELLRSELSGKAEAESRSVKDAVAVWLPAGYTPSSNRPATNGAVKSVVSDMVQGVEDKQSTPTVDVQELKINVEQPPKLPEVEIPVIQQEPLVEQTAPVSFAPPVPPQVVSVEESAPIPAEVPAKPVNVEPAEPQHSLFQLNLNGEVADTVIADRLANTQSASVENNANFGLGDTYKSSKKEDEDEEPVAKMPERPSPSPTFTPKLPSRPFPDYPEDAEALMKQIFPLSSSPSPAKKEINELVLDASQPLNSRLQEKKVEIGEALSTGPKINDIRKAISINEKYQMITGLFRNDEDMFERSIRTLNNFGSLPEARFWMQRELITKLGWNDQDEMVQHFQKLVNRRFA